MASAAIPEGGGRRGRKSVDAIVNVVPFIDLLSCCLAFLLMTAVWTQVSKLPVQQSGPTTQAPPAAPTFQVGLCITEKGYRLNLAGNTIDIARSGAVYDTKALLGQLRDLKAQRPDQRSISVTAEDGIQYEDLVLAIDTCAQVGLDNISVESASG